MALAWPIVVLLCAAGVFWLCWRYLLLLGAKDGLERRVLALEATKEELDAAVVVHRAVVEKIQDLGDRIGKVELERGLGQ